MNRTVLLFFVGRVLLLSVTASAATHFVDLNNPSPASPYTSWGTAATNIQDAVDAAAAGDVVLVTNGVYQSGSGVVYGMSNRVAVTKPMTLMSVNGPGATLIVGYQVPGMTNGDQAVRCVYITNGALLSGFTLTNGATRAMGDYYTLRSGGGVWCESTDAVVSNCVLIANASVSQGGAAMNGAFYQCAFYSNINLASGGGAANASLNGCTLSGNSAGYEGGGVYRCTLNRCTLQGNVSWDYGGGAYGGTLSNCALVGNWASAMGGGAYGGDSDSCNLFGCTLSGNSSGFEGGGTFFCTAIGCVFTGNSSIFGGGAERGTLNNCTFTRNSAAIGGGVDYATINNCILFYNRARSFADNYSDSTLNYCCTTPLPSTGTGNRADEPQLASDSHLSAISPCRGSGSATFTVGADIDGEAWADPPAIGCDEYRSGSLTGALNVAIGVAYTNVSAGFSVNLHALIGGRVSASRWNFGDGTVISNRPLASHAWLTPGTYTVELRAFNESYPGGSAQVVNIQVVPQPVHYVSLTSVSPGVPYTSWETAATNIQDAVDVAIPGALVLVTNGTYQTGGRMIYGSSNRVAITTPVTLKSVNGPAVTMIAGLNTLGTTNEYAAVRCVYLTNGATVAGFTLTNGSTTSLNSLDQDDSGGGVWCEWADCVISNCVLAGNSASYIGGGAYSGTLIRCVLMGNSGYYGGGASGSIMSSCVLKQNSAAYGGGSDHGSAGNCTYVGNSATYHGGGAYAGTLVNSILLYNNAPTGNYEAGALTNCCTSPLTAGDGNFANDPIFVSTNGWTNLRLQSNSPCINAGNNVYANGVQDLDGRLRIVGGAVDVGAYEFQPGTSGTFIGWLGGYGLPTDGSADFADSDQDGMNNWQEWTAGTNPRDNLSALRLATPRITSGGVVLTWSSVGAHSYSLERASSLSAPPAFTVLRSNISGLPGTTSATDTNAVGFGSCLYRVRVEN